MSIETFEKASTILWESLAADGYTGIMQYTPFSNQYWEEKCKIVLCNYENLGYEKIPATLITHDIFKGWITYKKSKTAHFTAVFANTLKTMMDLKNISVNDMKKSYYDTEKIWEAMKNMVYMNIRPTSGANAGRQNKVETQSIIKKYKIEIRNYIDSLDADVLVVSSKDAVNLINYLYDLDKNKLTFNGKTRINNMFVYSVRHFGWFYTYSYYHKKANEIFYDIYHK